MSKQLSDKNEKDEKKWSPSDYISLIGVILTIVTIAIGIHTTNKTFQNSFKEIQKSNMIEKSSELPLKLFEFTRNSCLAFGCNAKSCDSSISEEEREEFRIKYQEYDALQNKLLDEIHPLIFSYGSKKTIKVYSDFFLPLRDVVNDRSLKIEDWLPIYEKLPLLISLVKYDITGEIANPSIICEVYMPEFWGYKDTKDKFKTYTNQYVQEYNLSNEFIWIEDDKQDVLGSLSL